MAEGNTEAIKEVVENVEVETPIVETTTESVAETTNTETEKTEAEITAEEALEKLGITGISPEFLKKIAQALQGEKPSQEEAEAKMKKAEARAKKAEQKVALLKAGVKPSKLEDMLILMEGKGLSVEQAKKSYPESFGVTTGEAMKPTSGTPTISSAGIGVRLANKKKGAIRRSLWGSTTK